jgi:hypothetical protein
MDLVSLLTNQPLIASLVAGFLAQILKVLAHYIYRKTWDWSLLLRAGGMPSSHSAMVAAATHSLGLNLGFGSPIFAASAVFATIVIYDATGIRRQAGKHAEIINRMITELASGHPLKQEQLREVLGHTPLEALAGMVMGVVVAHVIWLYWR